MSDELKIAIEAAKAGAKKGMEYFNQDIPVSIKEDKTVVTKADSEAEEVIKEIILAKYPDAKFVGEEGGGDKSLEEFWIIDPIDGSRNFVRGIPNWCVLIALFRNNTIELGIVYYPHEKSLYYAQRGKGAYLNDKKISVSRIPKLSDSYFAFGSPRHFKNKQVLIDLIEQTASSRAWDATYCACLIASGKIDAYLDGYGKLWDLAPFKVLVEEAGGRITRPDGSEWSTQGSSAVMTNGLVHDEMLKVIDKRV